jgi:threonine-phosphate decarboxylase
MLNRMHGANPEKIYADLGIKMPERIIDFSTNTNVVPFKSFDPMEIQSLVSSYPDDECLELKSIISQRENCEINRIMVCNGTNEFIYLIASLEQYKRVALLHPLYSEYERALKAYNREILHLYSEEEIGHLTDVNLLYICNPNNPTGKNMSEQKIREIVHLCKKKRIDVVIDEAYSFFLQNENNTGRLIESYNNLYIMKSLTKIYNLSGIRIGYILSSKEKIEALHAVQPTWSVNALAQKLAMMYLKEDHYLMQTKTYYRNEYKWFVAAIHSIGYETMPSDTNFFLMKVKNDKAFILGMLKKGIVVRHTRNFKTLSGKYVRIAIKTREENEIFLEALKGL